MKDEPSKQPHPDYHRYIVGIRNNDNEVLNEIYATHLPIHIQWVKLNSGTQEDGQDNFQDIMEVIVRKTFYSSFILYYPFPLFLHGIAHKLWYKKLKNKKKEKETFDELIRKMKGEEYINKEAFEKLLEETVDGDRWLALMERSFQKISSLCQKLLTLYRQGKGVDAIAKALDMKSNAIYQRRSKCSRSWRKAMEDDSDFKECNPYNL